MNGYQNGDDPASYPGVSSFMGAFDILGYPTLTADLGDMLDAYDISKLLLTDITETALRLQVYQWHQR